MVQWHLQKNLGTQWNLHNDFLQKIFAIFNLSAALANWRFRLQRRSLSKVSLRQNRLRIKQLLGLVQNVEKWLNREVVLLPQVDKWCPCTPTLLSVNDLWNFDGDYTNSFGHHRQVPLCTGYQYEQSNQSRDAKLCWEDLDRVPVVVGPKMTICHLAESIKKVYYGTKCLQLLVKVWFENDAATKIVTF